LFNSNSATFHLYHGENKHIAARVLQDLTALSTSRPIEIYDVEMTIKACSHDDLPEQSVNIKTKRTNAGKLITVADFKC
jgi:phosphate starvation-inducible PhoH-like protein